MANLVPLNWQVPIVTGDRMPTPDFQRAWAELQTAAGSIPALDTSSEVSAVLDKIGATPGSLLHRGATGWQIITGSNGDLIRRGVTGWQTLPSPADSTKFLDGTLNWSSASANIQTLLDSIGSTQGMVLYRSASAWAVLSVGTNGQYLQTRGPANNPQWATLPTVQTLLDGISTTRGTILYRGAGGWAALGPGTSGNVLQTQGTGADPLWAAPSTANIQTLLDSISNVRGTVLYRGASGWAALSPGTAGQVFTTGGAGADPSWAAAGGGGTTNFYANKAGNGTISTSSSAFATKGGSFQLFKPVTLREAYATIATTTNGSQFRACLAENSALVPSGGNTITAIVATSNTITWLTGDPTFMVFTFSSLPSLVTGKRYLLLMSWLNAAGGTSALPIMQNNFNSGAPWPGMPTVDSNSSDGITVAATTPAVGNLISVSGLNNIQSVQFSL